MHFLYGLLYSHKRVESVARLAFSQFHLTSVASRLLRFSTTREKHNTFYRLNIVEIPLLAFFLNSTPKSKESTLMPVPRLKD